MAAVRKRCSLYKQLSINICDCRCCIYDGRLCIYTCMQYKSVVVSIDFECAEEKKEEEKKKRKSVFYCKVLLLIFVIFSVDKKKSGVVVKIQKGKKGCGVWKKN